MKNVLVEEFHVRLLVPRGLPAGEDRAARRAIRPRRFLERLTRAIRGVLNSYPSLRKARADVTR